ncbi:MAG: radical SAM protein [Candidatus Portnoybacteria bacterium]|nr:radical SAM protein [Candidatus Portnoybacteria bacterium]
MAKYVIQVMWHINNECNFKCRHCYVKNQGTLPQNRLEIQKAIVPKITALEPRYRIIRVGLLGGEPLLDPNIFEIIALLRDNGIKRIDIGTNGSLVTEPMATRLKESGIAMVQVSLEGPNATINDAIRGRGSFYAAVAGLKHLGDAGITTGIMTTVSKFNIGFMEEISDLAISLKAKILSFNRLLPLGRGQKSLCLSAEETRKMILFVHKLNNKGTIEVSSDDPLLYVPTAENSAPKSDFGGCGAGIGNLAIDHSGKVFPCRRLPIKVGNAYSDSLLDIIDSPQMDCFYNRKQHLKGKCGSCQFIQICGGCRAAAYAFSGDYLQEDPQCWINP